MNVDELRKLLRASSFRPFTVYTISEKAYYVPHPEFAWLTPEGDTLFVGHSGEGGADIVDVPLIARADFQRPPTKSVRGRRAKVG
ncbi:MAG: hypothetical protein HYY24_28265 [Verrucomicrobia bacterium]|nr:hypothetical protein [Verrucomicrobiota bacterium]